MDYIVWRLIDILFVFYVKILAVSHVIYCRKMERLVNDNLENIWMELAVTTETLSRNVTGEDEKNP
jgi:hypothetical protein